MAEQDVDERIPTEPRIPFRRDPRFIVGACLAIVGGMFVFAYANAALFVRVCERIGLISASPSSVRGEIVEDSKGRPLQVYFSAAVNDTLPINFSVENSIQKTTQRGRSENLYRFVNLSSETIYFRPVHDVAPIDAGKPEILTLEKCFCFDLQKIEPYQSYTLPVVYSFGDKLDPDTEIISMRYSLFRATKADYDAAIEAAKRGDTKGGSK